MTTPTIDIILNHRFALRQLLQNKKYHTLVDGTIPASDLTPEKEPIIRAHIKNIATALIENPDCILIDKYTPEEIKKEWLSLQKWVALTDTGDIVKISAQTRVGQKILDNYMTHFYDVGNYMGRTLRSLITEDYRHIIEKAVLLNLMNHSTPYKSELRRSIIMAIGGNSTVTKYKASTAKAIVQYYGAKRVLDPCIGWGGRMLGSLSAGAEYVGCEPDPNTATGLRNILNDPAISHYRDRAHIYEMPCEDVLSTEIASLPLFDMVLTSPPYFNLELYTAGEQSTVRYPTWNDWVEGWLKPTILGALSCLKETGVSCWSVKNFKTDKQYNLRDVVEEIHKEVGWKLVKTIQVDGPSRMGINRIGTDGKENRKSKEETYCFMYCEPSPSPLEPVVSIDYKKLTLPELKQLCKNKGIKGYSKLRKEEILTLLEDNSIIHV